MKSTTQKKLPQGSRVENARPADHIFSRTPQCLDYLPVEERVASQEVWRALHHYLRVGAALRRVTDEDLLAQPPLQGRSKEHARKGLQILDRLGLIARETGGSRRDVAIVARLRGASKPAPAPSVPVPPVRPKPRVAERDEPDLTAFFQRYYPAGLAVS